MNRASDMLEPDIGGKTSLWNAAYTCTNNDQVVYFTVSTWSYLATKWTRCSTMQHKDRS